MRKVVLLLGLLAMPAPSLAQSDARPEILVLGTYHMSNPGHDVFNAHADDVLSPRRQEEIARLIEVLKRFHPTKIAIEAEVGSRQVGQEYADYLADKYTLSRNEIDQIAFRLARELGHHAVYPVDEGWDFPLERVINYAKAKGLSDKVDTAMATWETLAKEQSDFLQSHSVLETLEYMNSDSRVARDVASYFALVPYGDPGDAAGPDLLATWYQRNIHIYHNIVALATSPNDRILVIYGAGHLGWLRQDVANDATVQLRKLADLTGQQ